MSFLSKLADCLGLLGKEAVFAPRIANSISPVAAPDQAFGWSGNLYAEFAVNGGVNGALTELAAVSITEDCFYALDVVWIPARGVVSSTVRYRLRILDPGGAIVWQQMYIDRANASLGYQTGLIPPTMYLHLKKDMKVQWVNVDATDASEFTGGSIALRKLYQEQI